ncbi:MAG: UPF0175 family protein [Candidatus Altiarchaeota archaeon]|nr:UPF0175 family protein [Candidatus Altiarchaeota archaeon]
MPVTITTRVEDSLVKEIDRIARERSIDRSTIIRQLLVRGTKEWELEKVLERYERGEITLWQAADTLGISLWEMIREARVGGTHVPYTIDDLKADLRAVNEQDCL